MYQVTFAVWFKVMPKVSDAPAISVTGVGGADVIIEGTPGSGAVTIHVQNSESVPLLLFATACTVQVSGTALVAI